MRYPWYRARWLMGVVLVGVALASLGPLLSWGEAVEAQTGAAATATPVPLYLPHLSRALVWPTPTLPPPILPDPYPGTICPVQGGAAICWPSARYTLSRGPGEACGSAMSPVFYLVSDSINLELYQGRAVLLRGVREEMNGCPVPLLRVTSLQPGEP